MKVLVWVESNGNREVPADFPFFSKVRMRLIGDTENLNVLMQEIEFIKSFVNRDISRFNMNLREFDIKIQFEF